MADTKTSAETDGVAPQNGDLFRAARSTSNVKLSWSQLVTAINALISGASIAWGKLTGVPTTLSGYGITDALMFRTISVAGQSDVVADSSSDTLTLIAGSNVTITTDATNDTITIASSGGGSAGIPGAMNPWFRYTPQSGATQMLAIGALLNGVGASVTTIAPSSGSPFNRALRTQYTSSAAAGNLAGPSGTLQLYPGTSNPWGEWLFGVPSDATGYQFFCGMRASTSPITANPSSLTNIVGIGFDDTDTFSPGNWQFYYGGGSITKVDTGIARAINTLYFVRVEALGGGASWKVTLTDIAAANTFTMTVNSGSGSGIPGNTQIMAYHCNFRNGAIATATVIQSAGVVGSCTIS